MRIQELSLAAIVLTICLAFLASVLLSAFGKPVTGELQGVINTSFTALVVVVPTWLAVERTERKAQEAKYEGLRAGVMLNKEAAK